MENPNDVKELIPEFFYLPEFLVNSDGELAVFKHLTHSRYRDDIEQITSEGTKIPYKNIYKETIRDTRNTKQTFRRCVK